MKNKNQTVSWVIIAVFVVASLVVYIYGNMPTAAKIGTDGKVAGNYSLASVMLLEKPYRCVFSKSDSLSKVVGTVFLTGEKFYGEFRIKAENLDKEFNSFLLVSSKEAHTWTSLGNFGYKSDAAESAVKGKTPAEQAQIIGRRDKLDLVCSPWEEDPTRFEIPDDIVFTEID